MKVVYDFVLSIWSLLYILTPTLLVFGIFSFGATSFNSKTEGGEITVVLENKTLPKDIYDYSKSIAIEGKEEIDPSPTQNITTLVIAQGFPRNLSL